MGLFQEFKEFAIKGNVVDMAVGVIVGGAFGKIVSSLVGDVVMPTVGILLGGANFTDLSIVLRDASGATPAVTLAYGKFIQTVIDFLIVTVVIFVAIQGMNRLKRAPKPVSPPPAPPEPSTQEKLLTEIRDLLKAR